jgi:hypothetical protein
MRFHLLTALALLPLAGCDGKGRDTGGDVDTDTDTDTDTDVDTARGGTGVDARRLSPDFLFFQYSFGIDADGALASVTIPDLGAGTQELPPTVEVVYGTDDWTYYLDDTSHYCVIEYEITTSGPYVFTPSQYFGTDVAAGSLTMRYDDCTERFDPEAASGYAPYYADFWGAQEWTVGIIPLPPENEPYFSDPDEVLGAQIGSPGFTNETSLPYGYTLIYETDDDLLLQLDAEGYPVGRAAADTVVGSALRPGWYRPQSFAFTAYF